MDKENTFRILKRISFDQIKREWYKSKNTPRKEWFERRGWAEKEFNDEFFKEK